MAGQPEHAAPTAERSLSLAEIAERVLRSIPVGVVVFDRQLRVVHRNQVAEGLFAGQDTVGEILAAGTVAGQYQDWNGELRRVLETGGPLRYDNVPFCSGGDSALLLNLACTPLTGGADGEVIGAVLMAEDITSRAGLEKRLAVSERLAAVGKLAAHVAHELNNPLDGILRYIHLSLRQLDSGQAGKVAGYLEESRKGLMRMVHITSELLEFSRSTHTHFDQVSINRTVEEAIRAMQDTADRAGVTIAAIFREEQMPCLRGGMLFQVCCNVIKNAIDAMPDGGRLTITTAALDRDVV
ncbi:MAG: PAS domain-containing protein, partial [Planctomycetota bacterium]